MSNVLVLSSSILGDASASRKLVDDALAQIKADGAAAIVTRDLAADPLPHLSADTMAAFAGKAETPAQREALALSDALIAELRAADTLVIGAPMYNFGIPSALKAWFDHVLRAGVTFRYTEAGPEGLVAGKRAIVVITRGGQYAEDDAANNQEPHLRTLLGFIGIADVSFVRAEKLAFGDEEKEKAISAARAELQGLAALKAAA